MRRIDAQSDLQDGIDPAPLPPIAPDGAPEIPELRPQVPPCPSLCQAGPCRHYHTFVTQADAANPMASVVPIRLPEGTPGARPVPGGTLYQAPAVYHEEQHHHCYPTSGVEMNLGAVPVLKCNRWNTGLSPAGEKTVREHHDAQVSWWKAERLREAEQDAKVQELVASASPPYELARNEPFSTHIDSKETP